MATSLPDVSRASRSLQEERQTASLDVEELTTALFGSQEKKERAREIARLVADDPVLRKDDIPHLSRAQVYKRALEKSRQVVTRCKDLNLSDADGELFWRFTDAVMPMGLHIGMFIPAIENQGTDAQQATWLPRAKSMAILGCYAQTEMGHGSNVQGLETTAEFDATYDEFVVHTPTLTATKWWPGGLGKFSTHALVFARLIVHGRDHGIQAFIVPLRDLSTHLPLRGVRVGDIGPKFGYDSQDNGFLQLTDVRIPRENMLMRYTQVDCKGNVSRVGHSKQGYATMMLVRANIVAEAGWYLAKAVTICVRYSAARRQFGAAHRGELETKILDYPTQQARLFPLLASCYAFLFLGRWMHGLHREVEGAARAGDYRMLPEVHACTAGLKALATDATAAGIEDCRRLCGGNGYLIASGIPSMFVDYVPSVTYEGDNTILLLQTARYLVKVGASQVRGRGGEAGPALGSTSSYLGEWRELAGVSCAVGLVEDLLSPSFQIQAFAARSVRLLLQCLEKLAAWEDPEKGFQALSVDLVRSARAHCQLICVTKFAEAAVQPRTGLGVNEHLQLLSNLFALSTMAQNLGEFVEVEYLSPAQAGLVRECVQTLLSKVRPSAVPLVDAFDFTDHYLGSAIGAYDGDVYRRLLEGTRAEPLNASDVVDGYLEHIRPLLQGQPLPSPRASAATPPSSTSAGGGAASSMALSSRL